jgi:hypothetical protein
MTEHTTSYEKQEWENGISPAKMAQGRKEANGKCHCGKLRSRHESSQVKICKLAQQTETVGKIMSDKDIGKMEPRKI